MDPLLERGAHLDLTKDDALDASLANHSPRAAEKHSPPLPQMATSDSGRDIQTRPARS
jgi:hypothetical protein